jgi:hypothetical protein
MRENQGEQSAPGRCVSVPSASCSRHFRDAPDFGLPTPQKRVWLFLNPEKPPSGLGEGVRFFPTPGTRALYTGYGSCLLDNLNG